MAALDFPASPTVGQKYPSPAVAGVPVYSWDGEKWTTLGGAIGSTGASDAIPLIDAGTGAAGSSTLWSRGDHAHPTDLTRAPIASPTFTGDPKAPTPAAGDNDTSLATTAFVSNAVTTAVGGIPGAPSAVVRYDIAQTLTAPQMIQARQNIYAAPFDAMAYGGLQINGSMEVSQEKGTSGTQANNTYICDGWMLSAAGSFTISAFGGPQQYISGFAGLLYLTVTTAQPSMGAGDFVCVTQRIEGWRIARLGWGGANAQPITIGFWTSHHRVGLYSGSVRNGTPNRSYAFTYTQNVADVAQYNVVTVPGDTTGTWAIDNTIGLSLTFSVACGSNLTAPSANTWVAGNYLAAPGQINAIAATSDLFRLTGVIVLPGNEAPSAARSPFVMRPYDQELVTCQRYLETLICPGTGYTLMSATLASPNSNAMWQFHTRKRATPTFALGSGFTWAAGTPVISPSVDQVFLQNASSSFYASGTAGNIAAIADARL